MFGTLFCPQKIQKHMDYEPESEPFIPGNVVSWNVLNYEVKGKHYLLREESKCG